MWTIRFVKHAANISGMTAESVSVNQHFLVGKFFGQRSRENARRRFECEMKIHVQQVGFKDVL
jgi:hypothetical protein